MSELTAVNFRTLTGHGQVGAPIGPGQRPSALSGPSVAARLRKSATVDRVQFRSCLSGCHPEDHSIYDRLRIGFPGCSSLVLTAAYPRLMEGAAIQRLELTYLAGAFSGAGFSHPGEDL